MLLLAASLLPLALAARLPRAYTPKVTYHNCSETVPPSLAPLLTPEVLANLPDTLKCGSVDVPMDWEKAYSPATNKVTIGFTSYTPVNHSRSVFFNPGGPGIEATPFAWLVALGNENAAPFEPLLGEELLFMDIRGSGFSNPLNCSEKAVSAMTSLPLPTSQADYDKFKAASAAYSASCAVNTQPQGFSATVDSISIAKDYNAVRQALGVDKVDFVGYSYGALAAARFAEIFPEHVGRFVMDAVRAGGVNNELLVLSQSRASTRLIQRADKFCMSLGSDCPFSGKGAVVSAFNSLLSSAPHHSASLNAEVTAGDIAFFVSDAFGGNPDFPLFLSALANATNGDAGGFKIEPTLSPSTAAYMCSDIAVEQNSFKGWNRINELARAENPNALPSVFFSKMLLFCSAWQFPAKSDAVSKLKVRVVWVTSDFDLNTPTEQASLAYAANKNSAIVVRHGDGHGTIVGDDTPARTFEIEFLLSGTFPSGSAVTDRAVTGVSAGRQRRPTIPDAWAAPQ